MFRPPLLAKPPQFALPDPTANPQWYGDFWIRYPLDPNPTPAYHGHDFKARAHLFAIINEIAVQYFSGPQSPSSRSKETILEIHSKLKTWYDRLPQQLTAKEIVFPSQLKLQ
jgi:hypothetical protein